jgi:uncharacterized protein with HEPN domain
MSSRDLILLLEDMLESALKIKRYTTNLNYDSFSNDEKTIDAVVRNFEIIGEAANRIDPGFRLLNSEIVWSRIMGLRNRLVHDYFGIDNEIVWTIIENDLEDLIGQIESVISDSK